MLFDGECNFCDRSVQFIIKRDPKAVFASLQSETGKELLKKHQVDEDMDSLVLIEYDRTYVQSSAALRICKHLKGVWKVPYVLLLVPKPLRDFIYNNIAKNRYKWFGKNENCRLPSPDERKRFLQ